MSKPKRIIDDIKLHGIYYKKSVNRLFEVRNFLDDDTVLIGSLTIFYGDAKTTIGSMPVSTKFFDDCTPIDKGLDTYDFLTLENNIHSYSVKDDEIKD